MNGNSSVNILSELKNKLLNNSKNYKIIVDKDKKIEYNTYIS